MKITLSKHNKVVASLAFTTPLVKHEDYQRVGDIVFLLLEPHHRFTSIWTSGDAKLKFISNLKDRETVGYCGDVVLAMEYATKSQEQRPDERENEMTQLAWMRDPGALEHENESIGKAGQAEIGRVRKSNNSDDRWRWEIVGLPGLTHHQADRVGWVPTQKAAQAKVQELWIIWLKMAGLSSGEAAITRGQTAEARLAEALKVIEPFAEFARAGDASPSSTGMTAQSHRVGDDDTVATAGRHGHPSYRQITWGHLRAARGVRDGGQADG